MAKGIDLSIAADTRSAMSAINRGLIDPLEDVSEALEQMGDDSKDASRDLERGMRDAQRRTDDAKDEIRKLRDELNKAGRAGKDTGRDVDDGMGRVKRAGAEASDELRQNLGETFSSFRGDLEDLPQIAQDVFGGLAGSIGGLPAAFALAAGAAGIGLLVAGFQQIKEEEEASKQRASEWAQAYIEAGGKVLNAATTAAKALAITTDPEQFEKATTNAKNWGVDVSVAIAAMAGETWALNAANESLAETERKLNEEFKNTGIQYPEMTDNLTQISTAASQGRRDLDSLTGEMQRGGEQADAYSRYLAEMAQNTVGATTKVDEFGDAVTTLPDGTTVYVDAETGQATTDLDLIEKKIYAMPSDKEITARVRAQLAGAQRDIDGFMVRNGGREIKIKTRVVTSAGWDQ